MDRQLRDLERAAASGDLDAIARLGRERARGGNLVWSVRNQAEDS